MESASLPAQLDIEYSKEGAYLQAAQMVKHSTIRKNVFLFVIQTKSIKVGHALVNKAFTE